MATKDEIRKLMREKLASFSDETEKLRRETKLLEKMEVFLDGHDLSAVAIYLAMRNELPTQRAIALLHARDLRVAIPVWRHEIRAYRFSWLKRGGAICKGPHGVPEPTLYDRADIQKIGLFITPGLAFSQDGERVGHGGGWYDRLLNGRKAEALIVGACYDFQVIAPPSDMGAHDVRMDSLFVC